MDGVQKDITVGSVSFYQTDTVTGGQSLILTMQPGEEVAAYRRYYLASLPNNCCDGAATVQVTAMAQMEAVTIKVDTDYFVICNLPALKEECLSVRFDEMDSGNALQMSEYHHKRAIKLLNGELIQMLGKDKPAVNFAPWGSATLGRQAIGSLI